MLELADNNYEISMINILSHGNNEEYKQKNRGHWQQRNGNPKKNMQKKILLKKNHYNRNKELFNWTNY